MGPKYQKSSFLLRTPPAGVVRFSTERVSHESDVFVAIHQQNEMDQRRVSVIPAMGELSIGDELVVFTTSYFSTWSVTMFSGPVRLSVLILAARLAAVWPCYR